jgi:hypothetical protein
VPNDSFTQQALARDARFQLRLQNALSRVAWEVTDEDPATEFHIQRAQFARTVISAPIQMAAQIAPSFVTRPNVFQFDTTYNFTVGGVITAAGDPDLESQLHTDWNDLAGVGLSPAIPPPPLVGVL